VNVNFQVYVFFLLINVEIVCQILERTKQLHVMRVAMLLNLLVEKVVEFLFERVVVDYLVALNALFEDALVLGIEHTHLTLIQ
jgi:hypothetical protein